MDRIANLAPQLARYVVLPALVLASLAYGSASAVAQPSYYDLNSSGRTGELLDQHENNPSLQQREEHIPLPYDTSAPRPAWLDTAERPAFLSDSGLRAKEIQSTQQLAPEIFGEDSPLDQAEFDALVEKVNRNYKESGEKMPEHGYAMTAVLTERAYASFMENNQESAESFIVRHTIAFDALLKSSGPSFRDGMKLKRIIVVKDDVAISVSYHLGYVSNGFLDSDGVWDIVEPYTCRRSSYYDYLTQIDWGWIHELGHRVLHLPDVYSLDFNRVSGINDTHKALIGLPDWALEYFTEEYSESSLMSGNVPNLGLYESAMLQRRINEGWMHDVSRTIPEDAWGFPKNNLPGMVFFKLASELSGGEITIFRTVGNDKPDALGEEPIFTGKVNANGIVNVFNLFDSAAREGNDLTLGPDFVKSSQGTLLIKVASGGKEYFRWLDIRYFNMAYWSGLQGGAGLSFEMSSLDSRKEDLDPTVGIFDPVQEHLMSRINMPIMQK